MSLDDKTGGDKLWAFEVDNITKAIRGLKQNVIDLLGTGKIDFFYVDSSQQIVSATTDETTLYTFTLTGDVLSDDSGITLEMPFTDADSLANNSMVIRLKYGSTTVATATYSADGNSPAPISGVFKMYLLSSGSPNAQKGIISVTGLTDGLFTSTNNSGLSGLATSTGAEDNSTDLAVTITVAFSTANTSTITTEGLIVKSI